MSFDLNEYIDVAQRITEFYERFPDGRLTTADFYPQTIGDKQFVVCHAKAYRTPDDPLPGDGVAWEPVPGPTQFTRDSELMNAQTAAWGRAIVALGFGTKKIASKQEVQARQGGSQNGGDGQERDTHGFAQSRADADVPNPATDKQKAMIVRLEKKLGITPQTRPDALTKSQASKLIEELIAVEEGKASVPVGGGIDEDIPF